MSKYNKITLKQESFFDTGAILFRKLYTLTRQMFEEELQNGFLN